MSRDEIIRALDWHTPTVEAGPQSLLRRIESLVAQAEAAEREACAQLVTNMVDNGFGVSERIVAAIRARKP